MKVHSDPPQCKYGGWNPVPRVFFSSGLSYLSAPEVRVFLALLSHSYGYVVGQDGKTKRVLKGEWMSGAELSKLTGLSRTGMKTARSGKLVNEKRIVAVQEQTTGRSTLYRIMLPPPTIDYVRVPEWMSEHLAELSDSELLVLLALLWLTEGCQQDSIRAGYQRIGEIARIKIVDTVAKAVKRLMAKGLVLRSERDGCYNAYEYRLSFPDSEVIHNRNSNGVRKVIHRHPNGVRDEAEPSSKQGTESEKPSSKRGTLKDRIEDYEYKERRKRRAVSFEMNVEEKRCLDLLLSCRINENVARKLVKDRSFQDIQARVADYQRRQRSGAGSKKVSRGYLVSSISQRWSLSGGCDIALVKFETYSITQRDFYVAQGTNPDCFRELTKGKWQYMGLDAEKSQCQKPGLPPRLQSEGQSGSGASLDSEGGFDPEGSISDTELALLSEYIETGRISFKAFT